MDSSTDQTKKTSSPHEQKTDRLKIVLDNPDNTYYSGQTIQGTVFLNYSEIRGIHFFVIGKAKCGWTEWFVRDSKPADGKTETSDSRYWGKEEHLNPAVYIVGAKNGTLFTPEKSYRFSFELKHNLPSTFRSEYGEIKYKMKFIVEKRWFNDKQKMSLKIIKSLNLNQMPATLQPFENQLTKNYGIVDSSPISLHVSVPKRGFVLGDTIPITVTIVNASKLHVEKLKYFLYQFVEYHSTGPSERFRIDDRRLLKKETDGVSKKSEQKYELVIDVPTDIPPSQDKTSSRLIHIRYEIKVEAKIGGLHKSLVITAPIVVGTVQHEQPGTFRISLGPQTPQTPDAALPRLFTNLSLELVPHHQSNRQSIQMAQYSISPLHNQSNRSSIQSPQYPVSPQYHNHITTSPPYGSPIGFVPNTSIGSEMNRLSYPPQSPYSINPYQPSAPPMSPYDLNSSAPVRPTSLFVPPSYDEACGNPRSQFNRLNHTAPPALSNIPNKS